MKIIRKAGIFILCVVLLLAVAQVFADTDDTEIIKKGVSVGNVDVGGMTYEEAEDAINKEAKQRAKVPVSIEINGDVVKTTLGKLGYKWNNESLVDDIEAVGKKGNILKRYKDELDLENQGMKFDLEMKLDQETLKKKLKKICGDYNVEAQNASLKATGSGFEIIPEQDGCEMDYDACAEALYKIVTSEWDGTSAIEYTAETQITKPKYTSEDCEKVSNTPMGSFSTTFLVGTSYQNRNNNIENGVNKIDGHVIYPGEQFSCNEHLAPWTEDNGWYPAGTYVGGGVEDSLGGGICQVSSTLYNALLRAEIKVVTRFSHSMTVSYVEPAADAALAGDYKDLVFENNTDAPIYVQGIYDASGMVKFNIYGHDTRDAGHSVEFEGKTVSTIEIKDSVEKDPTKPVGYREVVENGHTGSVAELWKITYENGEEVNRELLHTSKYAMSPRKVVEGSKKEEESTTKKDDEETTKKQEEATTKKEQATAAADETTKKSKNDKKNTSE